MIMFSSTNDHSAGTNAESAHTNAETERNNTHISPRYTKSADTNAERVNESRKPVTPSTVTLRRTLWNPTANLLN